MSMLSSLDTIRRRVMVYTEGMTVKVAVGDYVIFNIHDAKPKTVVNDYKIASNHYKSKLRNTSKQTYVQYICKVVAYYWANRIHIESPVALKVPMSFSVLDRILRLRDMLKDKKIYDRDIVMLYKKNPMNIGIMLLKESEVSSYIDLLKSFEEDDSSFKWYFNDRLTKDKFNGLMAFYMGLEVIGGQED